MPQKIKPVIGALAVIISAFLLILVFDHEIVSALFSGRIVYGMDLKHFYPWRVFIDQEISHGRIPLWAPYNFGGYPFVGSLQPAIFYPSTLLHLLFPIKAAYNLEVICCMLFMAFFMYLWLKEFSLSGISILSGMLIFSLSGFTAYRIFAGHISHLRGVVWLPLIFYACFRALKAKKVLELAAYIFIAAWAVGFEITSGFPQLVTYTFLNLLIFIFGYLAISKERDYKRGAWLFIFLILSVLLLFCVQVVPTLEGFRFSSIDRSFEYSSSFSLPFKGLINFVFPNFFGSPLNNNYRSDITDGYYWELQDYFSITGLILAILAVFSLRRKGESTNRNIILLMGLVSLFSLLIALGKNTPVYRLLYYVVPGISGTRAPARIFGLLSFSVATLSACGLDIFRAYLANKLHNRSFLIATLSCLAVFLIYSDLFILNGPFIRSSAEALPKSSFSLLDSFSSLKNNDGLNLWRIDAPSLENHGFINGIENMCGANTFRLRSYDALAQRLSLDKIRRLLNVKYAVIPVPVGHTYPASELEVNRPRDYVSTPCATFLEGLYTFSFMLKTADNRNSVPVAEIAILGCGDEIVGSKEIRATDFKALSTYQSFDLALRLSGAASLKLSVRFLPGGRGIIDLERIAAIPFKPDPGDIVSEDVNAGLLILKNRSFLARATFVPAAYVTEGEDPLGILSNDSFDPEKIVLLQDVKRDILRGEIVKDPLTKIEMPGAPSETKITRYSFDATDLTVRAAKDGFILLSQIYYPGWKAEIDGVPSKVLRADYALSCVQVEKGVHAVRVFYRPWYWPLCLFVSVMASLVTFGVIFVHFFRRKR